MVSWRGFPGVPPAQVRRGPRARKTATEPGCPAWSARWKTSAARDWRSVAEMDSKNWPASMTTAHARGFAA
eukprot:9032741-Alexandrium_andersonii.AAC.1